VICYFTFGGAETIPRNYWHLPLEANEAYRQHCIHLAEIGRRRHNRLGSRVRIIIDGIHGFLDGAAQTACAERQINYGALSTNPFIR
jgi:hypothetical protein